jgi:hypothetical protein
VLLKPTGNANWHGEQQIALLNRHVERNEPMTIQERIAELAWLNDQLQQEVDALTTTQHPTVHWFLIDNLTTATIKRAGMLRHIAQSALVESYDHSNAMSHEGRLA